MTLLQTHRFLLRPIEQSDAPVFARLCNDELIARNTARIPHPYTLEDAEIFTKTAAAAFKNGKEHAFAVCEQDTIIACCGVMRITHILFELGYWVAMPERGRGVATEAARAVSHFAFATLNAETLLAGHFADNPASGCVLEKIGFHHTGDTRLQFSLGRGGEAEVCRMKLDREAFNAPESVKFA